MKKRYTFFALVLIIFTSNAQIVNIPSANFKAKLLSASTNNVTAADLLGNFIVIDTNGDGEIQVDEAQSVYSLNVSHSNIGNLSGIQAFTNLRNLRCDYNSLTTLNVSGLYNLLTLKCNSNQITSLDISTLTSLKELDCSFNTPLSSLNLGNITTIEKLNCGWANITSLNLSYLTALQELDCRLNELTALNVSANVNLTKLTCSSNELNSLDITSLTQLQFLFCDHNQISELDLTNSINLFSLYCVFNQLTSLNLTGLQNLYSVECGANPLSFLNVSGLSSLSNLTFSNTEITSIDLSGLFNLQYMQCSSIPQLTSLDVSDSVNLNELVCVDNANLISLNIKNGRNENTLNFSESENLSYICADENQINAVQTLANNYGYTNCQINSYCSFVPGGTFYTIQGTTRFDLTNNGCDVSDVIVPNQKINFTSGSLNGSLIANNTGAYSYPVQQGSHTITPVNENPTYFNISPTSSNVTFPATASPYVQNFCVTANGTHNDLEVTLLPIGPARPGFDSQYKIIYKNKGTQAQSGSINFSYDDTILQLVSANPVTSSQGTDSLNWNFTNLLPFESREISISLNLNSPLETPPVNAGNGLLFSATAVGATDETPDDNTANMFQTVVNSFDPNDKTCVEGTWLPLDFVGEYVHYVIRFENTGTFAAENVVVKDIIDVAKFEIGSLIPMSGSHPFTTRIINTNQVEFIFENINLPFDDANNDGYVAFKIKTKPTLMDGDTFSNSASIYFDYNAPIITDTYTTTVYNPLNTNDFDFNHVFSLSPVPTKDVLTITTKQTVEISSVNIYNTLGQLAQVNTNPTETIDVSGLQSGSYFIKIISDKGSATGKFIKM